MKFFRSILLPGIAVPITVLVLWYANLPVPIVASNMAQVEQEAENGGYRLIDADALYKLYRSNKKKILLVDTRQEWEHRSGYIAESVNFPLEPTWWARWQKKRDLKALLGPDKKKTFIFY